MNSSDTFKPYLKIAAVTALVLGLGYMFIQDEVSDSERDSVVELQPSFDVNPDAVDFSAELAELHTRVASESADRPQTPAF